MKVHGANSAYCLSYSLCLLLFTGMWTSDKVAVTLCLHSLLFTVSLQLFLLFLITSITWLNHLVNPPAFFLYVLIKMPFSPTLIH